MSTTYEPKTDARASQTAGHFRVYLGVAPGVGKTIAMLDDGHRRRARGTDVVIAFVETHGRPVTQQRVGNLEIVPRRLADYRGNPLEELDTDAVLRRRLVRYRTLAPWQIAEHVMAGVTPAPGADAIVRRAGRIAEMSRADLDIVYVVSGTDGRGRAGWLARLRQVTSDVGASWHEMHAEDPAAALIEFARHEQVTQLVLGASDRNRWQELVSGGSIVKRISRLAARAGIDVHIVAPRGG